MPIDPLEEARARLSAAKDQLELAGIMLASVIDPPLDDLRGVHVTLLDVEVQSANCHAKVASLAVAKMGEPQWQRVQSEHRAAISAATERLTPDLNDVLDPRD